MKDLLFGVLFIVIVGFGGLLYRNVIEHPTRSVACPMDAKLCPDGTSVGRSGPACTFATCPSSRVSLDVGVSFTLPEGFTTTSFPDAMSIAAYTSPVPSPAESAYIVVYQYPIATSSTALAVIHKTAILSPSGLPAATTSSITIGTHEFTTVLIERFEGLVETAYYLVHGTDVLRFDAIDRGADWTNPNLDIRTLPAHAALTELLTSLQER